MKTLMYSMTGLRKKTKASNKLPEMLWVAVTDKVDVLWELHAIDRDERVSVVEYMEKAILAEPTRDPYIIIDQIARSYIDKLYK